MNPYQMRPYIPATKAFASGEDSPRAFLDRCIQSIEAHEPEIQAFVAFDLLRARASADQSTARWRAGKPLSAYDGMPVGVKDIIETDDFPTEMGSPLFIGWESKRDAAVVKALRAAGAVIIGKMVTTEFASGFPGKTRNPWDPRRTPGGSSSGSAAAVAAGLLPAALGTQVVGSILRPSSFCGAIGYKPTLGGINRGGSHDFLSQSCTGLIAASVEEAWILARDLAWRAGGDPGFPGIVGPADAPMPRLPKTIVALRTPGWAEADAAAQAAFEAGLDKLKRAGVHVIDRMESSVVDDVERAIEPCVELTQRLNAFESRWPYNVYRDMDESKMSAHARERLRLAFALTADDYRRDIKLRESIRQTYARLADVADCCVALSATGPAPMGLAGTGSNVFVVAGSSLGVPAWGLPAFAVDGLPLGLQVLGFRDEDATLAAFAGGLHALLGVARFTRKAEA